MHRIHGLLALTATAVLALLVPRSTAVQGSTVPCSCSGDATTQYMTHPCIESSIQSGAIEAGRCHRSQPPCTLAAKACKGWVSWIVRAKPECLPLFEWRLNGVMQPGGGTMSEFHTSLTVDLPCGSGQLVEILANGTTVLTTVVSCNDCSGQ